jgi:hypothetical protein
MADKKSIVGKLRATITWEWEVEELEHYRAHSMAGAALNTKKQITSGDLSGIDLDSFADIVDVKVAAVPLKKEKH